MLFLISLARYNEVQKWALGRVWPEHVHLALGFVRHGGASAGYISGAHSIEAIQPRGMRANNLALAAAPHEHLRPVRPVLRD
mmetsp:Transcript_20855/g.60231  ORF Transcript_20855/g.60231 Transcript_20855/m.60231 type:complete len:82 (-) Transcript_20855:127-372(-)